MIKIAPNQEIQISVCTSQGCTKEISAWTTEVPGLLVIRNGRCGLSDCYAVLPCALGDALGICLPSAALAARFAIEIRDLAPWGEARQKVWDALACFGPDHPVWEIAAAYGGVGHAAPQSI